MSPAPSTPGDEARETLNRLLTSAKLLQANCVGCVIQHHGVRVGIANDLPRWLSDTKADIERAEAVFGSLPPVEEAAGVPRGAVAVKPLEWARVPMTEFSSNAETIVGTYAVWTHHEADGVWFWHCRNGQTGPSIEADTEDAAKAGAEADYRKRILSAIAASEPVGTVPREAVDMDALEQEIRRVDGNHSLGAGALAEVLMPFLSARAAAPAPAAGESVEAVAWRWRRPGDEGWTEPMMMPLSRRAERALAEGTATIEYFVPAPAIALLQGPKDEADASGYVDAFYEIAEMLRVPAQNRSPKEVWETQMRSVLARLVATSKDETNALARIAELEANLELEQQANAHLNIELEKARDTDKGKLVDIIERAQPLVATHWTDWHKDAVAALAVYPAPISTRGAKP